MRRLASLVVLLGVCAAPVFAFAASFENVAVVDVGCSKKVAANPDLHTRDCALQCAKSGFGIVTNDQKFLKFDAAGNAKILEALKASDKKDHLRVNVDGEVQGDTLKVSSIKLL
ncbi:hypothetical protein [Alloacidobacterium sp.]|uniref:hypothetical protein n=1 Tax=Alloacidobacterium sp. TaxID=2951999 RepID=UPI002D600895|nr:hypothetical protein [Alloacidobacterium sp.]HYK35082.1 hypothetical protein [Alloacidobacterium sp.]